MRTTRVPRRRCTRGMPGRGSVRTVRPAAPWRPPSTPRSPARAPRRTRTAALMPEAIAAFRIPHPKVAVSLAEGLVREHVARLHAGDLDLAIVTPTGSGTAFDGLDLHHL